MLDGDVFVHRPAADQVLPDDTLQHLGRARVVPGPVGMDERDRAVHAHPQAVHLAAMDPAGVHETELGEPCREAVRKSRDLRPSAFGQHLGLVWSLQSGMWHRTCPMSTGAHSCERGPR